MVRSPEAPINIIIFSKIKTITNMPMPVTEKASSLPIYNFYVVSFFNDLKVNTE